MTITSTLGGSSGTFTISSATLTTFSYTGTTSTTGTDSAATAAASGSNVPTCYNKVVTIIYPNVWLPTVGDVLASPNYEAFTSPGTTTVTYVGTKYFVTDKSPYSLGGTTYYALNNQTAANPGYVILETRNTSNGVTSFLTTGASTIQTNDLIMAFNESTAPAGVVTTPGGNIYSVAVEPLPPFYGCADFSPWSINASTGTSPFDSVGNTNKTYFPPYYKTLMFTIRITSIQTPPLATFVSMNGTTVTCDDTTKLSAYLASNANAPYLAFRSEGTYSAGTGNANQINTWKLASVVNTNTFTVNATTSSNYTVSQSTYANGDSQNSIYPWEFIPYTYVSGTTQTTYYWNIPIGSALSASGFTGSGQGVVTIQNGTIGGVHKSGTTVGSYAIGSNTKRRIGTNTASDLEYLVADQIGSRFTTSLYSDVIGGVDTSFIVSPAPAKTVTNLTLATISASVTSASGSGSVITYTAANSFTAGQIVTITTGLTPTGYVKTNATILYATSTYFTVAGTTTGASSGTSTAIVNVLQTTNVGGTGIYSSAAGITKNMVASGSGIPANAYVLSVTPSTNLSTTPATVTLSAAPTAAFSTGESISFSTTIMNLAADITNAVSVAIVGQGANQEAVLLSGAYQSLDGSNNNVPIVWSLVSGNSFRFDHFAGEPVYTPNVLCSSTPLANDHAVDTPVVGSPDISTTVSATASAALIAQNV